MAPANWYLPGRDLVPGDVLKDYGRTLLEQLDAVTWLAVGRDAFGQRTARRLLIHPDTQYVVPRAKAPDYLWSRRPENQPKLQSIRVRGRDLAPGDVITLPAGRYASGRERSPRQATIVSIDDPRPNAFIGGFDRDAFVRCSDSSRAENHRFSWANDDFLVIGGPKLDAARANPALVKILPVSALWIGEVAHVS